MAGINPIKIYGLSNQLRTILTATPPPTPVVLSRRLSREEILSIFVSNNINEEKIRHSK
jgi:hypothetical protein